MSWRMDCTVLGDDGDDAGEEGTDVLLTRACAADRRVLDAGRTSKGAVEKELSVSLLSF